eukprot:CAMPEP_0197927860 /NCGR_PEP_ID=MMETSP1439-20131203/101387_1 /TAXON_ID=66791 /ORGANISM="Gonyaulax spinifera, Strain CCMP409" /LENGTH=96 /DNA_ID=CAMNT_0043550449 /DNA_START=138 /DNA_END=424 /DNA_ORIENTATION=-
MLAQAQAVGSRRRGHEGPQGPAVGSAKVHKRINPRVVQRSRLSALHRGALGNWGQGAVGRLGHRLHGLARGRGGHGSVGSAGAAAREQELQAGYEG